MHEFPVVIFFTPNTEAANKNVSITSVSGFASEELANNAAEKLGSVKGTTTRVVRLK